MLLAIKYGRRKYKEHKAQKQLEPDPRDGRHHGVEDQEDIIADPNNQSSSTASTRAPRLNKPDNHSSPPTPEDIAEKKRKRIYRWKIVLGLFAPFLLQALDTTIVASALPTIAAEFNHQSESNWIISAFNLTAAAFLPFWAQAADIFGRHTTIQLTILFLLIGSAICTGAPTSAFGALLVGRAIQGIGAAGVNISVRTVLADKVSLSDYAANWTLFALIAAVGYTIGPVIGGYLVEASWRWCFAINLPIAVVAVPLVIVLLRKELLGPQPLPELAGLEEHVRGARRARLAVRLATIDYVGQLLFLFGLGLLILALTWAGGKQAGTYPWNSAYVLAPLVIGALLAFTWVLYEYSMAPPRLMSRVFKHQRAMIPWDVIAEPDIGLLFFINFCLGMCMYTVMYFMDYYFIYVQGKSASDAGTALLYFLPGLGGGAWAAVLTVKTFPRQTIYPLMLGNITSAVGITVLAWAINAGNLNVVYGMMALSGFGVGIRMSPSSMHGLAYFPASTASITCIFAFALPFGGAVSLTIMSSVFNNKIGPPPTYANAKTAIMYAFYSIVPFMWLCVILGTFLGNTWVNKDGNHEVANGAYLWSFVTRKRLVRETRTRGGGDWAANADVEMKTTTELAHNNDRTFREPV